MAHRKRRIILRLFALLVLLLLVLVIALPLWFPWALRPIAKSLRLGYANYEREGYSRFHLTGLTLVTDKGTFRARDVRAFIPTVWFWKSLRQQTNQPFLQVNAWEFGAKGNSPVHAPRAISVYTNAASISKTFAALRSWLPNATLTNGLIRLVGNSRIGVPEAQWRAGDLMAQTVFPRNLPLMIQAGTGPGGIIQWHAVAQKIGGRIDCAITNSDRGMLLQGNVSWQSNRVEISAEFARTGALPKAATLRADHFSIPGEAVRLKHYRDVTGSLLANWNSEAKAQFTNAEVAVERDRNFTVALTATAAPLANDLPPINIDLRASGDTNSARIDTARVTLPWLDAELAKETEIQFLPPFLPAPTQLRISADLAKQDRFQASGMLRGEAILLPANNRFPKVSFTLAGNGISVSNIHTKSLEFSGELDWPFATIQTSRITLNDGSEADLTGAVNLASNAVARSELRITGAFGRELLPRGYSFESVLLKAKARGPFKALDHSGELTIHQLRIPNGNPVQLDARWQGRSLEVSQADLRLAASNAWLDASASLAGSAAARELTVSNLSLHTSGQGDLELEQPIHATFQKTTGGGTSPRWALNVQPLNWHGGKRDLELAADLSWPEQGSVRVSAHNLDSGLFADFVKATNAAIDLRQCALNAAWTNGPVVFTANAAASMKTKAGLQFAFAANTSGDGRGISIQQFSISSATQLICQVEGSLPFALSPAGTNGVLQIGDNQALQLRAFTETNSALWEELGKKLPLKLGNPSVRADVSGAWAKPQGQISATIERLELRSAKPLPVVSNLNFDLQMSRESADARLNALIQDQPIRATAQIPLGRGFWAGLKSKRRWPDLQNATGELVIPTAKFAAFADFAPALLAPQGEFNLNVKLTPGNKLLGQALIYNAGTRPLASLGPLRAIDAEINFSGAELSLTNLSAEIGGQRVTAIGNARIPDSFWRERRLPEFQLHIVGTNVPLVRQANALVRADLDLAITNSGKAGAQVTGQVGLRDSFYLSSLKALAPGRVAAPKRRPPYFSIEAEPFAGWRLGVQVDGDRFLKVRSPFFTGTASTTLRIEGTLKEPLALGEVRINSGAVTFPFGNLDIQQGFVSLTSGDPYRPHLFVNAGAQRMGYDIKLEASGPADQPVLLFSSSPPLSSEQIVLMLTTGQAPQGIAASSTRQRAQGLALFVGKNLLSDLGIGGGGDGRVTIRSGEQLTETGRPTYDVEYKLNNDWSIVGEYDRFNQYNLGAKWRVYSK